MDYALKIEVMKKMSRETLAMAFDFMLDNGFDHIDPDVKAQQTYNILADKSRVGFAQSIKLFKYLESKMPPDEEIEPNSPLKS